MSDQFEKHAREQFEQHQVSLDVDSLWDEVYPLVKEEKKDRKFLWFFFGGFFVSAALLAGFYLFLQGEAEPTSSEVIEQSVNQPGEKATDTAGAASEANTAAIQTTDLDNNMNTNTISKIENTINDNKLKTQNNSITKKSEKENSSFAASEKASSIKKGTTPMLSQTKESESSPILKMEDKDLLTQESIAATEKETTAINTTNINITEDFQSKTSFLSELDMESLRTSLYPVNLDLPIRQELPPLEELTKSEDGFRKNALTKGMRFGIGLYGGVSRNSSTHTTGDSAYEEAYLGLRNQSEEQLESIHLGLNFLIESKQNIYLRTGIEYTRIASLFSKETERVTVDSTQGIVEIRINNITNDTTFIEGRVAVTTTESYQKKTYNYFHIVDVPIIFGYNLGYDKWHVGIEAGVFANVWLKRKGDIFNTDESFYDIGADDNNWYKTNIGITPYVGLNGAYNISDYFQLHVSPGFRFNKVFTTDDSLVKVKLANLGVRVGLRYYL